MQMKNNQNIKMVPDQQDPIGFEALKGLNLESVHHAYI